MRNREPGSGRARQQNWQHDAPAVDDDRFGDHHIEEVLSTFRDAARLRESASGDEEQRLD